MVPESRSSQTLLTKAQATKYPVCATLQRDYSENIFRIHAFLKIFFIYFIFDCCVHVGVCAQSEGASRGWKRVLEPWSCSYRLPHVGAGD